MVLKIKTDQVNVYDLSGITDYRDQSNIIYEPLSPSFVEYVRERIVPNEINSLASMLECVEKKIRDIIRERLSSEYPQEWRSLLEQTMGTSQYKLNSLNNLFALANRNNSSIEQYELSGLNVMSFSDYFKIIKSYWLIFQPFFVGYKSLTDLNNDMDVLREARNSSAHLNLEIINEHGRKGIREICDFLLKNMNLEIEVQQEEKPDLDNMVQTKKMIAFGEEVIISNLEVIDGAVRGSFDYSGESYKASIDRKYIGDVSGLGNIETISVYLLDLLPMQNDNFECIPKDIDGTVVVIPEKWEVPHVEFGKICKFRPTKIKPKSYGGKVYVDDTWFPASINKKYVQKQIAQQIYNYINVTEGTIEVKMIEVTPQGNSYKLFI